MYGPVANAYRRLDELRPFVRPTDNELEVAFLPPYGDPEVYIPGEVGTYIGVGMIVNSIVERIHDE